MLVLAQGLAFLALVLLTGSTLTKLYLSPNLSVAHKPSYQKLGKQLGITLLCLATLLEALALLLFLPDVLALNQKLSYLFASYLTAESLTRAFFLLLAAYCFLNVTFDRWLQHASFTFITVGLVASFHLDAGTATALARAVVHQLCGTLWAAAVVYVAVSPLWAETKQHKLLYIIMKRVSVIGVLSVAIMTLTGVLAGASHIAESQDLVATSYGRVLLFKGILVANILLLAAANRVVVLPILKSKGSSTKLAQFVQIEAALLILVLFATSLLSNSPVLPGVHHISGF